jgi:cytochrome P450
VTQYEDVRKVLQQPAIFSSKNGLAIPRNPKTPPMPPLDADPPEQIEYRRLINAYLSPAGIARHEDAIRSIARSLVAAFATRGSCDYVAEFADQLPTLVLARVLYGLGDEDDAALKHLKKAIAPISEDNTSEDAGRAWMALDAFMADLLAQRRGQPLGDDLVASVLGGEVEGHPVPEDKQRGMLGVLLLAGLKTTTHLIASIVYRMVEDPSLEARLREPGWHTRYLEEIIRVSPVVAWVGRVVQQPTELGGVQLKPGDTVMCHIGAADHDPDEFPDPHRLDVDRLENRHIGFGLGAHRCVGSNLARTQARISVEELLAATTNFRYQPGKSLDFRSGVTFGPKLLRIEFDPIGS